MTIRDWIKDATTQLIKAGIGTAKLDAEIILAHTIRQSRTYIHMYGEHEIDPSRRDIADARLSLRAERVPIAYIIGHKDFYGRRFTVTPSVLVPRPESETFIELIKHRVQPGQRLVDVGTGSGCIGITAQLAQPELVVTLLDIDNHALAVAEKNARNLGAEVEVLRSDLLANYPYRADYIVANLPYVDPAWEQSPELLHEPAQALFAPEHGLALVRRLLMQASSKLTTSGLLLLETDERQHQQVISDASTHRFELIETEGLIQVFALR